MAPTSNRVYKEERHSIILVDYAYVGWRVHDACVFSNSSLYRKGQSNSLFPESIVGRDVPLVVLGDPAYPLLTWLMKAFPNNGQLSQQQCKAQVVVE